MAWRTLNSETCVYYRLMVGNNCDINSNGEVLIVRITSNSNVLQPWDLSDERNK